MGSETVPGGRLLTSSQEVGGRPGGVEGRPGGRSEAETGGKLLTSPEEVGGGPGGVGGPAAAAAPATPPFQEAAGPGARGRAAGRASLGRAARNGRRPVPRRRALTGDDGLVLHGVDQRRQRPRRGVHGRPASPARPPAPHGQPRGRAGPARA